MHLDLDHFLFPDSLKSFPSKQIFHTRAFCLISKTLLFSVFSYFQLASYPKVSMSPPYTLFLPLVTSINKFPIVSLRCCVRGVWYVCDKADSKYYQVDFMRTSNCLDFLFIWAGLRKHQFLFLLL